MSKRALIFSASSDIGFSLCQDLLKERYEVFGTYLTDGDNVSVLRKLGARLFCCDLRNDGAIEDVIMNISGNDKKWDLLVLLQASMQPIGRLLDINMDAWEEAVALNFTKQVRIIQHLLPYRKYHAAVITFAGGGTNSATSNYSAYTISKIALIKMMELLYEEYRDTKFVCIGPGWVDTKIHQETLQANALAGEAYQKTLDRYASKNFTNMETIIKCIKWIEDEKIEVVSGRNFSVANDLWDTKELEQELSNNADMYKLRREGNHWKI